MFPQARDPLPYQTKQLLNNAPQLAMRCRHIRIGGIISQATSQCLLPDSLLQRHPLTPTKRNANRCQRADEGSFIGCNSRQKRYVYCITNSAGRCFQTESLRLLSSKKRSKKHATSREGCPHYWWVARHWSGNCTRLWAR